ncbi:MAG: hypothetical protein HY882_08990 [Deltaproteobacteria bacterium]|nr:hypothetical protein [Deltaproteobacteria bacterium]
MDIRLKLFPPLSDVAGGTEGKIIPSWAVFLNKKIIPLNQPQALEVPVGPEDEISFILNIAGG